MAAPYDQERTEAATPRRRQQAREEGSIAQSREIVSSGLFLGALLFFTFAGASLAQQMVDLARHALATLGSVEGSPAGLHTLFMDYLNRITSMLLPLFLTIFVLALATNVLQTGFLLLPQGLAPKFSHVNPWQGLQRLFSMHSIHELLKSLLKIGLVGYIAFLAVAADVEQFFSLSGQGIEDIARQLSSSALRLGLYTSYALIGLAILDYAFQRWQHEKQLRMTLQEMKEEKKEEEGDPQIKARIRSIMREMARKRMMEEVPRADVVVTNPTHLAVALHYRRQDMPAPRVLAKGAGYVAERIKAVAQAHAVPLVENQAVAQGLFKTVEIGETIPEALYKAVAEILAYVYRLKPQAVV
jgi:flagellar biosynthetic protein FlhB